ncbi:MAG TPA: hypothetical protein VGK64_10945 [Bryobacteraceae bacterium]
MAFRQKFPATRLENGATENATRRTLNINRERSQFFPPEGWAVLGGRGTEYTGTPNKKASKKCHKGNFLPHFLEKFWFFMLKNYRNVA